MLTVIERRRASRYVVGFFVGAMTLSCQQPDETQLVVRAESGAVAEADKRTAIEVSAETRVAVLTEMRTMLKAVQGIVAGAAKKDTAAIRAAAIKGGMQAASEMDPIIQEELQGDFVQLGMRTHAAFDILAADVVQGNQDVILQRLASIMGNCVGCHEQWRLTVR